jgi:hypothetical protein
MNPKSARKQDSEIARKNELFFLFLLTGEVEYERGKLGRTLRI